MVSSSSTTMMVCFITARGCHETPPASSSPQSRHIPAAASPRLCPRHATRRTSIDVIETFDRQRQETTMEINDLTNTEYKPRDYTLERWIVMLLCLLFFLPFVAKGQELTTLDKNEHATLLV